MEYTSNILIESFSILLFVFSKSKRNSFFKNAQGDYTDSISTAFSSIEEDELVRTIKKFASKDKVFSFYDFLCKKIFLNLNGDKKFEECYIRLVHFASSKILLEFNEGWRKGFDYTQNIALPSFSFLKNEKIINFFLNTTSMDLRNLCIINTRISSFENIYINERNNKIFFVLGSYLSEDALAYSFPCNEEMYVSYYILSEIVQKILKENINTYTIIKKNNFIKNEASYYFFWKNNKTDFKIFILANAIVLKILETAGLKTHPIEKCLSQRGLNNLTGIKKLININQNLENTVADFMQSAGGIRFHSYDINSKTLVKNTKKMANGSIKINLNKNVLPVALKDIFNNYDYIVFGEQHNFIEYYTFLSNLIPVLYSYGFKYIYLEEDEEKQKLFDEYIDGKNDSADFLFFDSQKVLLKAIKDFNTEKSSKLRVLLYDIHKTPCAPGSFEVFFQQREKLLEEKILALLQQTNEKGIILCGATHACVRHINKFSKNYLNHTFAQGIKSFCQENGKKVFSFFSDAINIENSYFNYNHSYPLRRTVTINDIMNYKYSLKYHIMKKSRNNICFLKSIDTPLDIINYLPNFYSDNDICKYTSENLIITPFDLGFDGYFYFPFFTEI